MKKNLLITILSAFTLISCNTEPMVYKYKYESATVLGTHGWCCEKPGTTCLEKGAGVTPLFIRTYIENDNLAGYFKNENWRADFPNLENETEIVNHIIENNPKAIIINDELLAILKNRDGGTETENVYAAIMLKAEVNCDEFLGTGGH